MAWRRRWGLVILAVGLGLRLTGSVPARAQDESPAASRRYAVAVGFQNRKLAKPAAEEWRKFLAEFPRDPRRDKARHYLGVCLLQDGQLDPAIDEFKALLAASPKYDQRDAVYLNLGVAQFRRGRQRKSIDDERAAAETFAALVREYPKSPQVPRALYNQAESSYQAGRLDQAEEGYARLVREHPTSDLAPDAAYALGVTQDRRKQPERAASTFADFLAKYPNHALATECRLRRGEALFGLRKFAEAEPLFRQASAAKDFAFADYALLRQAGCLHEQGKTLEAASRYQELPKTFPRSPYLGQALLAAGKCLYLKDRYGPAREVLARASALHGPEAGEAAYWSGRCQFKEKKPAEALTTFEAALAAKPNAAARPLLMLGRADATAEIPARRPEASARYAEFARAFPDDPQAAQALSLGAFLALSAEQLDQARTLAAEFLTRYPKHELRSEALFVSAETSLRSGQYPEAAARFRELVETAPRSARAEESRLRRGLALSLAGQDGQVIATLSADLPHLKDKGLLAHALYLIGRAQADRKQFPPAIGSLRRSLETKPDWPLADETRLILAHCERSINRLDDASAELERLVSGFPNSPVLDQAYFQLGECASELNQLDRALAAYRESVKRSADGSVAPLARLGLGRTLYRKGDLKGAVEALDAVVKGPAAPGVVPRARYLRALAEHALKQEARALEDVDAFLATKPEGDEALDARFLKGLCQAAEGQHPAAVQTLETLAREHPKYAQVTQVEYELAFSQQALKRDKEAAETFRTLAKANPSGPLAAESWFRVGEYHYGAGQLAEAAQAYQEAVPRATDAGLREKVLHKLAWCAFKRGDFAGALAAFDRQAAEVPGGALVQDARFLAAESAFKQGQWRPALERFRKVAEAKVPAYQARALYRSGQCAGQLRSWSESGAFYKDLLATFPKFEQAPDARYGLGWALQAQGQLREAIDAYSAVTRETDTETAAKAQFMIGECRFAERDHAGAAREFLKAAFGYPYEEWAGNAHFEAGRCFEVLKQLDQARESYRTLTTKFPRHPKAALAAERLKELSE